MEEKVVEQEVVQKNFGNIKEDFSKFEKAGVVVLPVPYGNTASYRKGTEKAPAAIIDASSNMELYDDELGKDTYKMGIHTAKELSVQDLSPEAMIKEVSKSVSEIAAANKFPVTIGGEHTVSIGAVKGLQKSYKKLTVLVLDAHYDLRDSYNNLKLNHACVARRISEICPVVEVGMRSLSKEEKNFLPNPNVSIFNVYDILDIPDWKGKIKDALGEDVYISIDLDVFDPAIMPSVGTPEPGGLGWYETLELLRFIIAHKNIAGLDVTELCPIKDVVGPDFMAAKLIYRLLGYVSNKVKS